MGKDEVYLQNNEFKLFSNLFCICNPFKNHRILKKILILVLSTRGTIFKTI